MLRIENPHKEQIKLFDTWIPRELTELDNELATVDEFLDDDRIYEPIEEKCKSPYFGRPTVPMATYIRMMYLKRRYTISYEILVKEVSDSLKWRKFCHLDITDRVPDRSTLIKLTAKYGGEEIINKINDCVLEKAKEKKIIKGKKMRTDTTVVPANIHYPTDSSLIADSIRVITRLVKKIKYEGGAVRTKFRNRTRVVKKKLLTIMKIVKNRTGETKEKVQQEVKELVKILREVREEALRVVTNTIVKSKTNPIIKRARKELKDVIKLTGDVVEQTIRVLSGDKHIVERKVSIFDPGASVIKKGKLGKETEFGRKTSIAEAEKGIITHYGVYKGNPSDKDILVQELLYYERLFGHVPEEIATDRGYYSEGNEKLLIGRGVKRVSIPKIGKKTKERREYEHQYWFRRLQRFRAGSEAKISLLKRKFGLGKSLARGDENVVAWIGWGVFACNLWKIAELI